MSQGFQRYVLTAILANGSPQVARLNDKSKAIKEARRLNKSEHVNKVNVWDRKNSKTVFAVGYQK